MLCVASLSLYDQLFEPRYTQTIKTWLAAVKSQLNDTPLSSAENGGVKEPARGSSMALMLIFLHDIDPQFARHEFLLFKKYFVDDKFGLTGIREYVQGETGNGDIDSGPVVLGFGGAATIVGIQTLSVFDNHELSIKVRNEVETFAVPLQDGDHKQYLLGILPIVDAFIAWSHSGIKKQLHPALLFVEFHLLSLFVVALLSLAFWMTIPKSTLTRL